ncbi:neurotrimin-like isoform X2 [Amphiura filiformis]|uniref:neurotrimin-like isoform X2 n=1 Tax=Amphiura filiformis TaxID=82378 RepID=UPI003B221353
MIPYDKSYQLEGDFNKTFHLRINPVRPRHAGVYVCQVYLDTRFTPLQTSIELIVNIAATIREIRPTGFATPRISNKPKLKLFYNETDRIQLVCDADGMPTPNVTWRKSDGTTIATVAELVLENIQREDSGTYTCVADSFVGPPAEKKVEIVVQYPPEVTVRKSDIREPEGAYVWLECYVDAKPRAEYRWIKDNRTIRADEVGITENPKSTKVPLLCFQDKIRLIIISLNPESDYGRYFCVATNLLGNSTGMIDVSGKPRKPKIISDPVGNRKHKFNLIWNHGNNERREDPRSIEVNSYEIQYYGFWMEISGNTQRLIYSNGNQEPFKETVEVTTGQYRMNYLLDDLRENITYNVSLFGRNKYGDGEVAKFQFCTSSEDPEYISTTTQSTTFDIDLPEQLPVGQAKCWPADTCRVRSIATHHTAHLCLNLVLVFVFIRVLFL